MPSIQLRSAGSEDYDLLLAVYASTRETELSQVDWDDTLKADFVCMQFKAQDTFYRQNYPGATYQIIEQDGQPVGRLYLDKSAEELRIMDISVLTAWRGQGIGSVVMDGILSQAREARIPATIHVERFNPALKWYKRLGFSMVEDRGVYLFLKWEPELLMDLEMVQPEDFRGLTDPIFTIQMQDGTLYPLRLEQVSNLSETGKTNGPNPHRQAFSLLFTNPLASAFLPQRIYTLTNSQMGELHLFLVPLGPDSRGMRYEAVFN